MKWVSKWDGADYQAKPAHGTINHWKSGRCWSWLCNNAILYINVGRTGLWNFGYCYGDYEAWKYKHLYHGYKPRGMWFLAIKGKLTEEKWPKRK